MVVSVGEGFEPSCPFLRTAEAVAEVLDEENAPEFISHPILKLVTKPPRLVPSPLMGEGRRYFALVDLHQSKYTGRGCTKEVTKSS
jgi:hypothetical protein